MHDPVRSVARQVWRNANPDNDPDKGLGEGSRLIPEETAIALTYNGGNHAVMLGTPKDLADFAIGFRLRAGIVHSPADIHTLAVHALDSGLQLRTWLSAAN